MRRPLVVLAGLLFGIASASCNGDPIPTTKKGELGTAVFDYGCSGASDPFCDGASPGFAPGQFPSIAVGASFSLGEASSLDSKRVSGSTALLPGFAPMGDVYCTGQYPSDCPKDKPLFLHDIVHVKIVAPMTMRLAHADASGAYTQIVGVDNFKFSLPDDSFRAILVDDQGNLLAGAPPCIWTTSNPAVLTIQSDPASNIVKFHITGVAGQSDLHVSLGNFESTIPFSFN